MTNQEFNQRSVKGLTLGLAVILSLAFATDARATLADSTFNAATSTTGTVTITGFTGPGPYTAPNGPAICVGPNTNSCGTSGLYGTVTVTASQIVFSFFGSTNASTGTFVVTLSNFSFPFESVTYNTGTLVGGSFALTSFTKTSMVFTGTSTGGGFNATGGRYIVFDVASVNPFLVRYSSNLTQGDSIINISNTGDNGAALNGPGFAAVGNICANVYAFSPDEQLISCCSCPITPNGLVNITANRDLVSNTLTGIRPNSIVVKLVATGAGSDFASLSCSNSAALAGTTNFPLASGMVAWGTTLHSTTSVEPPPAGTPFSITETPFLPASLSAGELASITARCANIIGNGSTFGICRSCRFGGLGADKQ